jgi:hypothetical protein
VLELLLCDCGANARYLRSVAKDVFLAMLAARCEQSPPAMEGGWLEINATVDPPRVRGRLVLGLTPEETTRLAGR